LQRLFQRGAVERTGQRVAQGALDGEPVAERVAQRVDEGAEQVLELRQLVGGEGVDR